MDRFADADAGGAGPGWMSALAVFCGASVVFLVARDLLIPEVRDVEVWFGFELRGAAAWATAPLHWAIFAVGAWAFATRRSWILPAAAGYAFYVALSHGVWNVTSPVGHGALSGIAQTIAFSLPGFWLLHLQRRRAPRTEGWRVPSVPNLLSGFRLLSVPALLVLAWNGATNVFLGLFGLALLSDVLDGIVARRFGLETELGAQLDQWADFALWVSFPLAAWWLWPEIVRREAAYVVLAIVCLLLPTAIASLKYRVVPGYHTWCAKLDAILMGIGVPLLLVFDVAGPFRVAALFLVVCAVDELAITALLAECRHDVPSAFHAARMRRPA